MVPARAVARAEYDANRFQFLTVDTNTDYQQFSQEVRVNGTVGDVELTSGLYYWYSDYDTASVTYDLFEWLAELPDGSVGKISQHGETESYAAFTSADSRIPQKFTKAMVKRNGSTTPRTAHAAPDSDNESPIALKK